MKAIVIGAGGVARELLRRLGEAWEVTVIDLSEDRLGRVTEVRKLRTIQGDGASRPVLRRAGLEETDALIAASNDDEANLEACRIALEAGILRVAAIAANPERLPEYRDLGVPTVSPASLTARQIELQLETRRIASRAFAHGRAEAIEFHVSHDSPVRDKALRDLRARSWLVGAILRKDRLIIPHGETVLQAGDLVTVVGSAADFGSMVRTFTAGQPRFPLDFGKRVALAVAGNHLEKMFAEAVHLARNSRATSLLLVHRDEDSPDGGAHRLAELAEAAEGVELRQRPVQQSPWRALAGLPQEESVGVVVVPAPEGGGLGARLRFERLVSLARRTKVPVMFSRNSHPYNRILVSARRTAAGRAAARAAIDLARAAGGELTGLAVVDPAFLAGTGAVGEARQALGWLQEEAAVHGVTVHRRIHQGNPVRTIVEFGEGADLLVLGIDPGPRLFQGRNLSHLVRGFKTTVLIVPALE